MGLVPEGQGARAIKEGMTQKDGKLPVNPSGGLKAKGHPIGATGVSMHALSAMQLTGTAGDIQVHEREARRHLQHGRRGGRELRERAGTDQVAAFGATACTIAAVQVIVFLCGLVAIECALAWFAPLPPHGGVYIDRNGKPRARVAR